MSMCYIGLDIHKKIIVFCIKTANGDLVGNGTIPATRSALSAWIAGLPQGWIAAMEARLFTGWVYEFLKPHADAVKVAHPEMLKAITAAKKKNDRSDAEKICDLLRVDMLLQTVLVEAAKLAPQCNPHLARVHQKELAKGNRNKATLAVARKLVAYMLAVDKNKRPFQSMVKAMAA